MTAISSVTKISSTKYDDHDNGIHCHITRSVVLACARDRFRIITLWKKNALTSNSRSHTQFNYRYFLSSSSKQHGCWKIQRC